jgi:hypothetical protein
MSEPEYDINQITADYIAQERERLQQEQKSERVQAWAEGAGDVIKAIGGLFGHHHQ